MRHHIILHVHSRTRDSGEAALLEDLANRMAAALEQVMGWAATRDVFREADHPRASDGRFGNKSGEHGGEADLSQPKPTTAKGANAKTRLRELLESGHPFTKQELMGIAGITNESTFTSWVSMLRNPKYAGKAGALEVVKNKDGTYQAQPKGAAPPAATPAPARPVEVTPAPTAAPKPQAAPAVTKVPATTETPEELGARYVLESNKAGRLTRAASTVKQHASAIKAHARASVTLEQLAKAGRTDMLDTRRAFHAGAIQASMTAIVKLRERDAHIATKLPSNEKELAAKIEARYMTMSVTDIHRDLKSRFGLGVAMPQYGYGVGRKAKKVDLATASTTAKDQRRILGHVHHALSALESSGFDIKAALTNAHVEYAPARLPGGLNGLAWQENAWNSGYRAVGRMAVSGDNRLGVNADNHEAHNQRISQGLPSWSRSSAKLGNAATRTTIVHELTHALGMQGHIESPARLEEILHRFEPDFRTRQAWIKRNVSEYAAANIRETDAEIAAMVTDPAYIRGTLPKVFEDHVDWLFKKRSSKP